MAAPIRLDAKGYQRKLKKADKPSVRGKFLDALLDGKAVSAAAAIASVSPHQIMDSRKADPEFDQQVLDALEVRGELSTFRGKKLVEASKVDLVEDVRSREVRPTVAAESMGISAGTLRLERNRDPDFDQAVQAAENAILDKVEDSLYSTALKGNVRAIEIVLYNKRPEEWAPQRVLERKIIEDAAAETAARIMGEDAPDEETLAEKQAQVAKLAAEWAKRLPDDAPVLRLIS